jgi:hypothetical protein
MAPVIRDGKWEYLDDSGATQGPFTTAEMSGWFAAGYLATDRQVRKAGSTGDYVGLGNIAELAPAPATVEEFARAAAVTQPVISVTTAEATAAATVAATAAATAAPVAVSEVGVPTTGGTTTVRRQRGSRGRRGRGRAAAAAEGGGSGEGSETTVALADPLPASTALAAQAALAQAGRLERAVNEAAQSLLRATHAAARAAPSARRGLLSRASGQVVAALRQATSGETRRVVRRTQDQQRGRDLAVREARQLQRSDALQHNQGRSSDGSFQRGNNRVGRRHNHDQNRRAAQSRGPIRRRR